MNNKKTKICLNAMVGNEAPTITRMLDSVAPYIDYWVIQCNGTEDNTKEIIENFFKEKGIPGFTYEVEWQYPGWNRDHTLQECLKAEHGCDWILRMDADEKLHVEADFDWSVFDDTKIQSFNMVAQNRDVRYFRTWVWNAKLPWYFQHDKRHETIHLPEVSENFQRVPLPMGFRHLVSQDGSTWHVPRKFLKDALELEIDKIVGDKVHEDTYHLWYIAKSYADCYGNPNELPFGYEHSCEFARRAIWYYKKFLEVCHEWHISKTPKYNDEMAYFTFISMADCYKFMNAFDDAIECYFEADKFYPNRNEHWMYLALLYDQMGQFDKALEFAKKMIENGRKNPWPDCSFLVENRAYADTSTFPNELIELFERKLKEPVIQLESVKFEFA